MKLIETIPGAKGFTPTVMPAGPLDAGKFKTLPLPPRIRKAPGFWQTDEGKQQLAVARSAFSTFTMHQGKFPCYGLFNKVLSHTRCIDPLTFGAALEQMRQSLIQFLDSSPYGFVCLTEGRSESFVMNSLLRRGLPHEPDKRWESSKVRSREGMKYVVVDDATYSGHYIRMVLSDLHGAGVPPESIFLGVVGMTHLLPAFEQYTGYVYAALRMSTVTYSVALSYSWELEMLTEGDEQRSSLTFPWYKIPDRLCPMLRKTGVVMEGSKYPGNPSCAPDYNKLLEMMIP